MKKLIVLLLICFVSQSLFAQKSIAIYWDASYSMKERKLDRELKFLDNYFKKNSETNVTLVMFSNDVLLEDTYEIRNADWSALKQELKNTVYDGSTAYSVIFKDSVEEYLLFTDGIENIDKLKPPTNKPIYIIASKEDTNVAGLRLNADLSSGRLIMLNTKLASKTRESKEELFSNDNDGFIKGRVAGYEGNLPNVSVINQNTGQGVASDESGNYRIEADKGDILVYSFLGKKTVSVRIDKADIINITMANIQENLGEVVLTAEAEKEEFVNTGNQKVDKKRLGYAVQSIDSEEISDQDIDLVGAAKGQFSNFILPNPVYNEVDISKFLGRGRNMTIQLNQFGIIVVDGVPLAHSESNFDGIQYNQDNIINPDMIESITYLKGLAATNKYGTLGRNGVLLITTKNASLDESTVVEKKALGTTATYSGNAETIAKLPNNEYIRALKATKDVNEAFSIYLQQRMKYGDDPVFYLDTYDYFQGWNNPLLSQRVLSNVYEVGFDNVTALRALAYKQQGSNDLTGAVKTYERLLKLEPDQSQSYRDLALAYTCANNYEEALKLYDNIDDNIGTNKVKFLGLQKTINNETKNFVALNSNNINTSTLDQKFRRPIKYKSRIVFEWNDLDAEFDLNIINPQNRFFTWSHTQAENSQRIIQQHDEGFGLEEFYLTSSDQGEWKFNVTYYGKTSNDQSPTFIKITTYKNFGSPNQTKSVEVVRLDKKDVEQTVTKVVVN